MGLSYPDNVKRCIEHPGGMMPKVSQVNVRLTEEERRRLSDLACRAGVSNSEIVRRMLRAVDHVEPARSAKVFLNDNGAAVRQDLSHAVVA